MIQKRCKNTLIALMPSKSRSGKKLFSTSPKYVPKNASNLAPETSPKPKASQTLHQKQNRKLSPNKN